MIRKILSFVLLGLLVTPASHAYDLTKNIGLGLTGAYNIPVFGNPFNSKADADFGFGVHGRYHFNQNFLFEAAVTRSEFDGVGAYFDNLNLMGLWRLKGAHNWSPLLGAGLGLVRINDYGPKSLKLSGLVRTGVEYGITQWFSAGVFVDYQYISKFLGAMPDKRIHTISPQVALTWYFGNSKRVYESVPESTPIIESTSKASLVDESNLDSDNDGVKDPEDRCPSTVSGAKVNAIGCAIDEKATMQINVEFATGKAELAPEYETHMKEVAAFLEKYSDIKVQIEGHTDNTGSRSRNITLSQKRAEAVMNALIKEGVDKKRVSAKGFGPDSPLVENNTPEGRQTNRRVVAVLSSK